MQDVPRGKCHTGRSARSELNLEVHTNNTSNSTANPLNLIYRCDSCEGAIDGETANALDRRLPIELTRVNQTSIANMEKFLATYEKFLHPNHAFLCQLRQLLCEGGYGTQRRKGLLA